MRSFGYGLPLCLLLATAGCGGGDEVLAPTLTCSPAQPPSGWPSQDGVLHLDGPLPPQPFTPTPHRAVPPLVVDKPTVLHDPKLVTIVASDDPLADTLLAFSDAVPKSAWWTAVSAEYGVGTMRPNVRVRGPSMPGPMNGPEMVAYVSSAIAAAGPEAAPDGNTIFLLFLAPGVEVYNGNSQNCGCSTESGAHFVYGAGNDAIGFVQRCRPNDVEALTVVASHEILESATDPRVSGGYLESGAKEAWKATVWAGIQAGGNELGDLCTGTRVHEGAWEYQRSFSNAAALKGDDPCVPALAEPYYNVTADDEWYPVAAGAGVDVEVRGWSTSPREDWFVYPRLATVSQLGFVATVTSDESDSADGLLFYGINDGKKAKLHVQAPMAPSGTYAVVRLISRLSSPGSDTLHFWPVGFYIP